MDPPVPPIVVAPTTPTTPQRFQQQQQRPSLSYLLFTSLLFFMMSNNNSSPISSSDYTKDPLRIEQILNSTKESLVRKEMKRDRLADWLGIDRGHWNDLDEGLNITRFEKVEGEKFEPKEAVNPVLRDSIQSLVRRNKVAGEGEMFYQNLTGMARGTWKIERDYIPMGDRLGLQEVWNSTELTQVEGDLEEESNTTEPVVNATGRMTKRQETGNDTTIIGNETRFENVTIVHNRTLLRNAFDFEAGGKISFELTEDQSTLPNGSFVPAPKDGQLIRTNASRFKQDWESVGPTTFLRGELTFTDKKEVEEARFDIEGVHFLDDGTFYAYVTPTRVRRYLYELVGLPGVIENDDPSAKKFRQQATGRMVVKEVDRLIDRDREELRDMIERGSIVQREESEVIQGPKCIWTLYGSLKPLPKYYTPSLFAEYYASLYHPTGSSLRPPPPPSLSFLLYSENCGLVVSGEAELLSTPRLWEQGLFFAVLIGFTQMIMVWVLARQLDKAAPGHAGKVAYFTIGIQTALDAYFFVSTFTVAIVTDTRASLPFLVPAFFALCSSLIFSMRYAAEIRNAAPPPPARPTVPPPPPAPTVEELAARAAERRALAAAVQGEAGEGTEEDASLLEPTPITPATPARSPEEVSDFAFLSTGFIVALTAGTIIVIWGWVVFLTTIAFSYWIPQIVTNLQRGTARGSLRREYIVVTTLGRLVLPCYFWGYKDNVFAIEPTPAVILLVLYSVAQAILLLLQDTRLGARFFLPEPAIARLKLSKLETWDYHPMPSSSSDLESSPTPFHSEDCPICLSSIQIRPTKEEEKDDPDAGGKLRWTYMVPPCHHYVHTECMESWMAVKSVCPICRSRLPSS